MNPNFVDTLSINLGNKTVLVTSDLHIGVDIASQRSYNLINKLLELSTEYDYLILNGDILELWKFGNFGWSKKDEIAKLKQLYLLYPKLKELLSTPNVIVIHGNHDYALATEKTDFKVYRCVLITDLQIHIEHGNDADNLTSNKSMLNKSYSFILRALAYLSNWLYNLLKLPEKTGRQVEDIIFIATGDELSYNNYSEKINKKHVIFGHTHRLGTLFPTKEITYYNSGCCLTQFQALKITSEMPIITYKIDSLT